MISQSVEISRPPSAVWDVVTDLEGYPLWNPKVVSVERLTFGTLLSQGDHYRLGYFMSGKRRQTSSEIIECVAPTRLSLRHMFQEGAPNRYIDECYELHSSPAGTLLSQRIDLRNSGIPWLFRMIITALGRWGHSVEKNYLLSLKERVEHPRHL